MKTMMLLTICIVFGAAGCGGAPDASSAQQLAAPAETSTASGATDGASCTPVDACDPDQPLFCARSSTDCFFLYPNQHTVPVTCLARPASKSRLCS